MTTVEGVIGRVHERLAIERLLAGRTGMLVVEGAPGLGKSALLEATARAAIADADGPGGACHWRVLRCRPTQSEAQLAYAALGDLLAPFSTFDGLPEPQRIALDAALLRTIAPAEPLDQRAVGVACTRLWELIAGTGTPTLLIIDDLQWLDPASADALEFSLRRLPESGIAVVAARRPVDEPIGALATVYRLGPLAPDELDVVVCDVAPGLSPAIRQRVVTLAGGNPLYARELARSVRQAPGQRDLHLPPTVEAAIAARFADLDEEDLEFLRLIAFAGQRDMSLIDSLDGASAAVAAERAHIVDSSSGTIVFEHPLFEAAIRQATTPLQQRLIHRRLATVVRSAEERTRHLGLADDGPDAQLADDLGHLAESLLARAATDDAAEIAAHAVRCTAPDDPRRWHRLERSGTISFAAGRTSTALASFIEIASAAPNPADRFRALINLCAVAYDAASSSEAIGYAQAALDLAETRAQQGEAHGYLARVISDDFATAEQHAEIAISLLSDAPHADPGLLGTMIAAHAGIRFNLGKGLDVAAFERAIALEGGVRHSSSAFASLAALLRVADEPERARLMFEQMLAATEVDGDGGLPYVLSHLPTIELVVGRWSAAAAFADQHLDAARRTMQDDQIAQAIYNVAIVAAHRGDLDTARSIAGELIAAVDLWTMRNGHGLLGFVALSDGDLAEAVGHLTRWNELSDEIGARDPGQRRFAADHVEALIASGDLAGAGAAIERMEVAAAPLDRRSATATVCRVRALLAAADGGDADAAVAGAQHAVELFAGSPLVFEQGRALLTLGQIHRRFKHKAAARDALTAAQTIFEELGALGFAERTRRELARLGLRSSPGSLTQTEGRIAALAAAGRTVREIADEMYVSPKTVEANLTRIYRKLALRNRAELATWFAAR